MRILLVHNRYRPAAPSGEDKVVDQEMAALLARGHDVELFERRSAEIDTWSRMRRASLAARVVRSPESRRRMAEALVAFAPDVVHVHNTFPLITASVLLACRDAAVPVVATLHNYRLGCARGETFRAGNVCHDCIGGSSLPALVHGCYRNSRLATVPLVVGLKVNGPAWRDLVSAYIFNTAVQRDVLAPVGFPRERCFVKHHFVPSAGLPVPADRGYRPPLVAFAGRLDEAKGVRVLMSAWEQFRELSPASALRLVILGGGPLEDEVRSWASHDASVTFRGLVSRDEVLSTLAGVRAALFTSLCEETFGLTVAEAMAVGTPAIASARGAFTELITPNHDGVLYTAGDAEQLALVLRDVEDSPVRWETMGAAARTTYEGCFTPEVVIEQLEDVYRFAMERPVTTGDGSSASAIVARPGSRPDSSAGVER